MAVITGNTFAVKDQLKALGGRWNQATKSWTVPDAVADQARALVAGAPKSKGPSRGNPYSRKGTCKTCGCKINYGVYCGKCEYS